MKELNRFHFIFKSAVVFGLLGEDRELLSPTLSFVLDKCAFINFRLLSLFGFSSPS
jgi:hypothetical protein